MTTELDAAAVTRAVREMNAAEHSLMRARQELRDLLGAAGAADVVVLHCLPGEAGKPDTLYWAYGTDGGTIWTGGGPQGMWDNQAKVLIVEAPKPREEYLPRLA